MASNTISTTIIASALSAAGAAFLTAPAFAGDDPCGANSGFDVTTVFVGEDGYGGGGSDIDYYGTSGGKRGFAVGTTSCNRGNVVAPWYGGTDNVPVIQQSCYRLLDGRFEQIGMSWLKHSFCAVSEPGCDTWTGGGCNSTGCNTLGIGCADTYWAGLNADADAPRSEINATTGEYVYPFNISPSGPSSVRGKLQLVDADYLNLDGATFFMEAQYVEPNEHEQCDGLRHLNNASHCKALFNSATSCVRDQSWGSTAHMVPAIYSWETDGATVISLNTIEEDQVPGRVNVGWLVTDNGNGTWHYEYAVHNQNSHRSIESFQVPVPAGTTLTNVEFRDIHYHSSEENVIYGTDWTFSNAGGNATWTAVDEGPATNAIRWATTFNFRFDANAGPEDTLASLGYWRAGAGSSVVFEGQGPGSAGCPGDLNGDNVVDVEDVLTCIAGFGTDYQVEDLLEVLAWYGTGC
jgi:hypothetical protein